MMSILMTIIFLGCPAYYRPTDNLQLHVSLKSLHGPQHKSWLTKCLIRGAVVTTSPPLFKTGRNLLLLAISVQKYLVLSESTLHASLERVVLVTLSQKRAGKEKSIISGHLSGLTMY